jgi:uncharacterized protein YjbI with pentapeptide repeats
MKYEIKNRFTGDVQFTAEIDAKDSDVTSRKIELAVKWAINSGAYLRGADLRDARLSGAYLSGAYLRGAYLSGDDLRNARLIALNARLIDADLRSVDMIHNITFNAARFSNSNEDRADLGETAIDAFANETGARPTERGFKEFKAWRKRVEKLFDKLQRNIMKDSS